MRKNEQAGNAFTRTKFFLVPLVSVEVDLLILKEIILRRPLLPAHGAFFKQTLLRKRRVVLFSRSGFHGDRLSSLHMTCTAFLQSTCHIVVAVLFQKAAKTD